MSKKIVLATKNGKRKYTPDVVVEIVTYDKKLVKYLENMMTALDRAGIFTAGGIWTTTETEIGKIEEKIPLTCYTLPVFLPKGLYVNKSKFSKEIFDKYHKTGSEV